MHSTNTMEAGEGGPACLEVGAKASLEIFGLLVLTLPMAYVYVLNHHTPTKPFQRYPTPDPHLTSLQLSIIDMFVNIYTLSSSSGDSSVMIRL